ncbi:MAG TPA: hypothetical protein VG692_04120, partial [Gemmatimonadales bacterium]|nr:hypothetical protein [Gemmatimonadales bacterium]
MTGALAAMRGLALVLVLVFSRSPADTVDSVLMVLSPALAEPRGVTLLRGTGWRGLWGDSIRLPLVHAEQIGGGIAWAAPDSTTAPGAVALQGADGQRYLAMPVVRDLVNTEVPPRLRGTAVGRTLRDLLATTHPTAPLAAGALYQALGLDVIVPRLLLLAEDASLPPALQPLAGHPVWLSPDPAAGATPFGRFRRVMTSEQLLTFLREQPGLRIDLPRFLAARLLDLVLGDRSRGPAHWLWGEEVDAAGPLWVPIAIHQEEAFLRADGGSRLLLSRVAPGYGVFGSSLPDIAGLAATADDLDRPLLARLDRVTWDSVTAQLADRLTAGAIQTAIAQLPPPHQSGSGPLISAALLARRASLPRTEARFYRLLTRYADIELTDSAEEVRLEREFNGDVDVRVTSGGRETLRRRFRANETEELRLHLGRGGDRVTLAGADRGGVGIRLTSSDGVRLVREASAVTRRVVLYARTGEARLSPSDAVRVVPETRARWHRWQGVGQPPDHPDWGVRRSPVVGVEVGHDVGVSGLLGMQWMRYGFGQPNYRQLLRVELAYATRPKDIAVGGSFERRDVLRHLHLFTALRYSGIDVVRYYGPGNETARPQDLDRTRAVVRDLSVEASVGISSRPQLELRVGPVLSVGRTDTSAVGRLLTRDRPYGSGRFTAVGLAAGFRYAPGRAAYERGLGVRVGVEASAYPGWLDVRRGGFGRIGGTVEGSWTPAPASRLMLRSRL